MRIAKRSPKEHTSNQWRHELKKIIYRVWYRAIQNKITSIAACFLLSLLVTLTWNALSSYFSNEMPFLMKVGDRIKIKSMKRYPPDGPVIVTFISNSTVDFSSLKTTLKSLRYMNGDDPDFPAPILVFHEGFLTVPNQKEIAAFTNRPVAFPIVNFLELPSHFEVSRNHANKNIWADNQIQRFWISGVWKHPALQGFETIMKIEQSSCFKNFNERLPRLFDDDLVYHSRYIGYEQNFESSQNLVDLVQSYVEKNSLKPANENSMEFITTAWKNTKSLPIFNTKLEVVRKSFMNRNDVSQFNHALTDAKAFDTFQYRWSLHAVRYITMALFAEDGRVLKSPHVGWSQNDC